MKSAPLSRRDRLRQILESIPQKGLQFRLQLRYRSWTVFDEIEHLPLPTGQVCFTELALELRVNKIVEFLEPVTDRSVSTSVDHELIALPQKLILVRMSH